MQKDKQWAPAAGTQPSGPRCPRGSFQSCLMVFDHTGPFKECGLRFSQISFRLIHKVKSSCHNALPFPAASFLFPSVNLKRRAKKRQKKQFAGCAGPVFVMGLFFKWQEGSKTNHFFLHKVILMPSP